MLAPFLPAVRRVRPGSRRRTFPPCGRSRQCADRGSSYAGPLGPAGSSPASRCFGRRARLQEKPHGSRGSGAAPARQFRLHRTACSSQASMGSLCWSGGVTSAGFRRSLASAAAGSSTATAEKSADHQNAVWKRLGPALRGDRRPRGDPRRRQRREGPSSPAPNADHCGGHFLGGKTQPVTADLSSPQLT